MKEAIQISKNFIKGHPINNSFDLIELAHNKQSVYHHVWGIKPASVIINMTFSVVQKVLSQDQLFTTIKLVKLNNK